MHKYRSLFSPLLLMGILLSPTVLAAPLVEIVAMQHPPIRAALAPVRAWLAEQQDVEVIEIDIETPEGIERMADVGLSGHIPLIILVNGEFLYKKQDGSSVALLNFPDRSESPPGVRGNWRVEDVEFIVRGR